MQGYSALVRRLGSSTFNYWFGYVANGLWVAWLVAQGLPGRPGGVDPLSFAGYVAFGLGLWTLAEYVLHRYVYHVWPSFLSHGHGLHHAEPRALIGVPWWLTSVALWGIYRLLCSAFAPGPLGVTMGSCWAGYMAYCLLHHGSHHWSMRQPYLRNRKRLHQLHHAYPDTNWGFTTSLWDVLFGTYLPAPHARRPPRVAVGEPGPASSERRRPTVRRAAGQPDPARERAQAN